MAISDLKPSPQRRRLNLSLPPRQFDYGLEAAQLAVSVDDELGAIAIEVRDADLEILLGPPAAIDLILRLVGSLHRIHRITRAAAVAPLVVAGMLTYAAPSLATSGAQDQASEAASQASPGSGQGAHGAGDAAGQAAASGVGAAIGQKLCGTPCGVAGGAAGAYVYESYPSGLFDGSESNDNEYNDEMSGGEAAGDGITGGDMGL